MRDDVWDGEIIVLSSLRKIILSSEYYEPAYDTSIGNFAYTICLVNVKCDIIGCSTRNNLWNEEHNSTSHQHYYSLIDKLYVIEKSWPQFRFILMK